MGARRIGQNAFSTYFTYETIAFDSRMDSGVDASESTAPLALCAFIVMTALAAAIPNSGSFSSTSARKLFCGKTGIARSVFPDRHAAQRPVIP